MKMYLRQLLPSTCRKLQNLLFAKKTAMQFQGNSPDSRANNPEPKRWPRLTVQSRPHSLGTPSLKNPFQALISRIIPQNADVAVILSAQ